MKIPWGLLVFLALGLGALVVFDRYSTREDRWREKLAAAVAVVRTADSVDYAALRERLARDSVANADLLARAEEEEARRIGLAQELGRTRVLLANARTMPDTVAAQARIIVQQDSVIASDSVQKTQLRTVIAGKDRTIADLTTGLEAARARLADLIAVAERPPKEFKLLGFSLSLKKYLGVGVNVSPAFKAAVGVQLGLAILIG